VSQSPLVDAIFGLLTSVEEVSEAAGESALAAIATKDEIEGTIGAALKLQAFVDRGRGAVGRLTDPKRDNPPGTFETLMETGDFLFGGPSTIEEDGPDK
jgi:hypothetical protein